MSFWISNVNEEKITGEFELGGVIEPIPAGTKVTAFVEEAKWDMYQEEKYISLKWKVLAPKEYKNRIVFQKVKVLQEDETKAAKAQKMLLSINHNAGGKLHTMEEMPTTVDLQKNICNKPMIISLQVWELDDGRSGNWVAAVMPKNAGDPDSVVSVEFVHAQPEKKADEDVIPF